MLGIVVWGHAWTWCHHKIRGRNGVDASIRDGGGDASEHLRLTIIRKYGKSGKAVDTKFDEVTIKIVDWWFYVGHEVCNCICSSGDSQQLSTTMMSEWAMINTIDLNSFNVAWPKRVLNDMYKTGYFRRKLHLIYHVPVPKEVSKIPLSHKSLKSTPIVSFKLLAGQWMFCDFFHFTTLVGQNTLRTLVGQNPTNIKHPCLYSNSIPLSPRRQSLS